MPNLLSPNASLRLRTIATIAYEGGAIARLQRGHIFAGVVDGSSARFLHFHRHCRRAAGVRILLGVAGARQGCSAGQKGRQEKALD